MQSRVGPDIPDRYDVAAGGQRGRFSRETQGLAVTILFDKENLHGVGVKLEETTYCLGPKLEIDTKTEQFVGENSAAANKLLRREYRQPFVVPDEV